MLNRDAILRAPDLKSEVVLIHEWGGEIRIKELTGKDRAEFEDLAFRVSKGEKPRTNLRLFLARAGMVGEDNQPLFTEADIDALAGKSAAVLEKVAIVVINLSKLNDSAKEDAVKN